jgi:hypothetical protein
MRVLCDSLDLLESMTSPEVRAAAELIIDTGRRPAEICRLPYDCLQRDPGTPPGSAPRPISTSSSAS